MPAGRTFYFWEPRTTEKLAALYRERGVAPGDTVILARWESEPPLND